MRAAQSRPSARGRCTHESAVGAVVIALAYFQGQPSFELLERERSAIGTLARLAADGGVARRPRQSLQALHERAVHALDMPAELGSSDGAYISSMPYWPQPVRSARLLNSAALSKCSVLGRPCIGQSMSTPMLVWCLILVGT